MRNQKGITLIALVITIVVLIILAGVAISLTIGNNGIFNKAKEARNKTEYASALEIMQLKIGDANIEKISAEQRTCTIDELAEYMGKVEELEVSITKYYEVAAVSNSLVKPEKISGFLVKVVKYPKYTFKIGETCTIEAVSTDEGVTLIPIDEFKESSDVPPTNQTISSFDELLSKNGITGNYTKEDIANNKDGTLEKILDNKNSIEYIFNNPTEYMDTLTASQEAMTLLGQEPNIRQKVINSYTWSQKIANSEYRANFNEYIVYNKDTLVATAGGRGYYKRNDGTALAASFYRNGAEFIIVAKDTSAVLSYCSYNPSYDQEAAGAIYELEYNNEKWYYTDIPYAWTDGTGVSSTDNSKNIGNLASYTYEQVALYMLNDYFGVTQ